MDDEDEVRDLNLSSRPLREERRRLRERGRLERGMARSHHLTEHNSSDAAAQSASQRKARKLRETEANSNPNSKNENESR